MANCNCIWEIGDEVKEEYVQLLKRAGLGNKAPMPERKITDTVLCEQYKTKLPAYCPNCGEKLEGVKADV